MTRNRRVIVIVIGPAEFEDINEFTHQEQILELSSLLGNSWRKLGLWLGLKVAALENIQDDHHADQEAQGHAMLLKWTRTSKATKSKLREAVMKLPE